LGARFAHDASRELGNLPSAAGVSVLRNAHAHDGAARGVQRLDGDARVVRRERRDAHRVGVGKRRAAFVG